MKPLIEFKNVSYAYHTMSGETSALKNINFSVEPNDFVAIVGPSGCGKSTLLSLMVGLIQPETGSIHLNGKPICLQNQCCIGYMFQKDQLFEWRTIEKNLYLGLEIQKKLNDDTKAYANKLLRTYGLYDFRHARPSELSGGMRQRAALIRTLLLNPDLLLLDEPFSALDYQTRLNTADEIGIILKKEQKTAILVTHDIAEAISLGNKIIVLSKRPGKIVRIIPIDFDDTLSPLQRRNTSAFHEYFNMVWKELNQDE